MTIARAAKRVRLAPEARRAQLIALGVELLATRRLEELSVELTAKTAGISRGLLFHYFASKQEFHLEVARAAAAEMLRRTEAAEAAADDEDVDRAADCLSHGVQGKQHIERGSIASWLLFNRALGSPR